ncbi:hypothetical protein GCM10028825_17850 [Spirosoma agri]
MADHFDPIRFEIARRYIELAESGHVDDKYLERARLLVDTVYQTGNHKRGHSQKADQSNR